MSFGTQLKKYRKEAKFTQQQLAKKSGVSRTYLSDVENNRYNPSVEMVKKLSYSLIDRLSATDSDYSDIFSTLMSSAGYSSASIDKKRYGSVENFRYSLIKELYEETVINGGVKERSPKTFDYIGGEKFINEVYEKVTELNLGYEDAENIKNLFRNMYSRKLMAYANAITLDNASSYVSDFINQDEFHEKGNPVHESALKDTITCFEDCDSQIDDSDIVAIYLNNINYYENETSYRVYSKESYIDFLELRIKAFESQLEKDDLDRITTSVFNNSIKIDKRMIEILRSL